VPGRLALGTLMLGSGEMEAARREFEAVLEVEPDNRLAILICASRIARPEHRIRPGRPHIAQRCAYAPQATRRFPSLVQSPAGRQTRALASWSQRIGGLFVGVQPIYGLHLPLCLIICLPLRLDVLLAYAAANISNPLLAPIIVLSEIQLGSLVLDGRLSAIHLSQLKGLHVVHLAAQLAPVPSCSVSFSRRWRIDCGQNCPICSENSSAKRLLLGPSRTCGCYPSNPVAIRIGFGR